MSVALLAFAALMATVVVVATRTHHTVYSYTIDKGTGEAITQGATVAHPLPTELNVKVGDTLKVTNNDVIAHTYTFLVLRPGETGSYTFHRAGSFTASCTVSGHSTVTITVT